MKHSVITFDGPAGVGKSTVSRCVASMLGVAYLDTGAMYRSLALRLGPGAEALPAETLYARCAGFNFQLEGAGCNTRLLCNGVPVGEEIRTEAVGAMASQLAAVQVVREYLQAAQQRMGEQGPLVAEGRDMGVKVFPKAMCKFFLDAAPEVRAKRRFHEMEAKGLPCALDELTEQIRLRDNLDRSRTVDPLRQAEDAHCIDTSNLSLDEVVAQALAFLAKARACESVKPGACGLDARAVNVKGQVAAC